MYSITFIELPPFTRHIYRYMSDEEYQGLQRFLSAYPNTGDVIPGTRGCRKLRWGAVGRGKRGGVRIIYYYQIKNGRIYLLTLYAKNEEANLPSHFVRRLREEIKDD
jgi:mRNA-degrading endonuclease RelE of RelBE toxin-antitoxin system